MLSRVTAPSTRQRQQPQRVTSRSGVEQHAVVAGREVTRQDCGELVERRDLHRACAGELLRHARQRAVGQHAAIWSEGPLAVVRGRLLGIDVRDVQAGHIGDRNGSAPGLNTKHIVKVGGRVGADEQRPQPAPCEGDGNRTGGRGLPDPALAGEEHMPDRPVRPIQSRELGGRGERHAQQLDPGRAPAPRRLLRHMRRWVCAIAEQ